MTDVHRLHRNMLYALKNIRLHQRGIEQAVTDIEEQIEEYDSEGE